jgi:hypothetical protein
MTIRRPPLTRAAAWGMLELPTQLYKLQFVCAGLLSRYPARSTVPGGAFGVSPLSRR